MNTMSALTDLSPLVEAASVLDALRELIASKKLPDEYKPELTADFCEFINTQIGDLVAQLPPEQFAIFLQAKDATYARFMKNFPGYW